MQEGHTYIYIYIYITFSLGPRCDSIQPESINIRVLLYNICNSRHEPIGVRGFVRVWGRFCFKVFGPSWENQRGKTHVICSLFPLIAIIFRNAPNIKYSSLILGPYPQRLSRNKCHRKEALYELCRTRLPRRPLCHIGVRGTLEWGAAPQCEGPPLRGTSDMHQ